MNSEALFLDGRISLQLDLSVPLEALILMRLSQVASERRKDWLHALLVNGFLSECRSLRSLDKVPTAPEPALAQRPTVMQSEPDGMTPTSKSSTPCAANVVSLAALQKVVG